jgi:hypothetical protein
MTKCIGHEGSGLLVFGAVFFFGTLILLQLGAWWRSSWHEASVMRAGIFSYRELVRSFAEETTE